MDDAQTDRQYLEVPRGQDVGFGDLMDALVASEEGAEAGAGAEGSAQGAGAAAPDAAGGAGSGAAPAAEQGGAGAVHADAEPAGGGAAAAGPAGGAEPGGAEGTADGGAEQPAPDAQAATVERDVPASTVIPYIGSLGAAIEENVIGGYRVAAFEDAQKKYGKYFEALSVHPRMLVGREVPSMSKDGTERLESSQDAREWQEAVQLILQQEIEQQADTWMQDAGGFMETVHSAIDMFRRNPDLIPHTKEFDKELADAFASMAGAYEVRIDGKLHGYSVPVQPIIDNLRKQMAGGRQKPPAAASSPPPDPPQQSLRSRTPKSSETDDFSTLFGTIGLPHLKI